MKTTCTLPFAIVSALALAGCEHGSRAYFQYRPTIVEMARERAEAQTPPETPAAIGLAPKDSAPKTKASAAPRSKSVKKQSASDFPDAELQYVVTDQDIVQFSDQIMIILRKRSNVSRMSREISATMQVLSAAAAATLAAFTGGTSIAPAVVLAGSSAAIPGLQTVWDAKGRAEAYTQGVQLVTKAESDYFHRRAEAGGTINNHALTVDGAILFEQTQAALELVENAINQIIPSVETAQKAAGIRPQELKLTASSVELAPNATAQIGIADGSDVGLVASLRTSVVTAQANGNKIDLTGLDGGVSTVTIVDKRGNRGTVTVTVPLRFELDGAAIAPNATIQLSANQTKKISVLDSKSDVSLSGLPATKPWEILSTTAGSTSGQTTFELKGVNANNKTHITISNGNGARYPFWIEVVK